MTDRTDLHEMVTRANPVVNPNEAAEHLATHESLLALIDDRNEHASGTTHTSSFGGNQSRWRRPIVAFASAMSLVLVVFGATFLLSRDDGESDAPAATVTTQPTADTRPVTVPTSTAVVPVEDPAEVIWTRAASGSATAWFSAVARGNGRFVVVGNAPGRDDGLPDEQGQIPGIRIWISDDALIWTRIEDDALVVPEPGSMWFQGMYTVAFGDDRFVAGGALGSDAAIWISSNGEDWSRIESPSFEEFGIQEIRDITSGGPGWIAVGRSELVGRIWISDDGETWQSIKNPGFDGISFHSVTQEGDQLVALAYPNARPEREIVSLTWVSTNGTYWEPMPQTQEIGPETHHISVNPVDGSLLALGDYGVWRSTDGGATWVELVASSGLPPYSHPTHDAVWLGERIVAVHAAVGLFTSIDGGVTWSRVEGIDFGWIDELISLDGYVIALGGELWIGQLEGE